MIIIPEIETVLILVPRTGSGALRRAVAERYPQSMLLYRHMEADGIPAGYDRWRKIGVARDPLDRLWSLYKFLKKFDGQHAQAYIDAMRASVDRPFEDWLLNNEVVFTSPYDRNWSCKLFYPQFTVRHPMPENRKSQFLYLRPDLGTQVYPYELVPELAKRLDLQMGRVNVTGKTEAPQLSEATWDYLKTVFSWDFSFSYSGPNTAQKFIAASRGAA